MSLGGEQGDFEFLFFAAALVRDLHLVADFLAGKRFEEHLHGSELRAFEREQNVADLEARFVGGGFVHDLDEDEAVLGVFDLDAEAAAIGILLVAAGRRGQRDLDDVFLVAAQIADLDLVAGGARLQGEKQVVGVLEILAVE